MRLLDNLERKYQRYAIHNATLYIILGQVLFFVFQLSGRFILERVLLIPELVLMGEWWRLITFLFIPPLTNPIFAFFAWYLFYLMGNALENHWGAFRYNLFLLAGYFITVAVSFIQPMSAVTNVFIGGSVFLAFAFLYPDFVLYIFFILPVKIKWLALLTWIGYAYQLLAGSWSTRLLVLASISNFLLFFGRDILWRMKSGQWKMARQARELSGKKEAFHRCSICGITDLSHPTMEFRYCNECGGLGYCEDHILNHEHRRKT
jgi:membrane protein implicated in regulation of membrane protease activity